MKLLFLILTLLFASVSTADASCIESLTGILNYKKKMEYNILRAKIILESRNGTRKINDLVVTALMADEIDQLFSNGTKYGFLPWRTYAYGLTDQGEVREGLRSFGWALPKKYDAQLQRSLEKMASNYDSILDTADFLNEEYFRTVDYKRHTPFKLDLEKIAETLKQTILQNEMRLKSEKHYYYSHDMWTLLRMTAKQMELYGGPNFFPEIRPIKIKLDSKTLVPNSDGPEDILK